MMRFTCCEACGGAVIWARTKTGKQIPIDAEASDAGNVVLRHKGTQVHAQVYGKPVNGGRLSHFVSCTAKGQQRSEPQKSAEPTAERCRDCELPILRAQRSADKTVDLEPTAYAGGKWEVLTDPQGVRHAVMHGMSLPGKGHDKHECEARKRGPKP